METNHLAEQRETFILRLWRDTAQNSEWRCHVQSVRSGEVLAFRKTAEAFAYIQSQLDPQEGEDIQRQGLR